MSEIARRLRRNETEAETLLWKVVRDRRCGGYRFLRQVPAGQYVVDFYCAAVRLVIEVDGAIHERSDVKERDTNRQEALIEELHCTFLRLTNEEVLETQVYALKKRILVALEEASQKVPSWDARPSRRR